MDLSRKEKTEKLLAKEFLPENAPQKRSGIFCIKIKKFQLFEGYRHLPS